MYVCCYTSFCYYTILAIHTCKISLNAWKTLNVILYFTKYYKHLNKDKCIKIRNIFFLFRSELQHPVAPCNAILVLRVCSIHILVSDVRQLECCFILDTVVRGHTVQPKYLQIGKESIALVLVFNQREVESEERRLSAINILLTFHTREHGRVVSSGGSRVTRRTAVERRKYTLLCLTVIIWDALDHI